MESLVRLDHLFGVDCHKLGLSGGGSSRSRFVRKLVRQGAGSSGSWFVRRRFVRELVRQEAVRQGAGLSGSRFVKEPVRQGAGSSGVGVWPLKSQGRPSDLRFFLKSTFSSFKFHDHYKIIK